MTSKDTWNKRIELNYLSRLEEQVNGLCRKKRYAEALVMAEKAYILARKVYGPEHHLLKAYLSNISHLKKVVESKKISMPVSSDNGPESEVTKSGWRRPNRGLILKTSILVTMFMVIAMGIAFQFPASTSKSRDSAYASLALRDKSIPLYKVKAVFLPEKHTLEGEEEVVFFNDREKKEVLFDLYFNRYRDTTLNASEIRSYAYKKGIDAGYIDVTEVTVKGKQVSFTEENQTLRISLNEGSFPVGENSINIKFTLKIPYISDRSGGDSGGVWLGNWLPTIKTGNSIYKATEIGDPFINQASTYETEFTLPKDYKLVLSDNQDVEEQGNYIVYRNRLERVRDLPVFFNKSYKEKVLRAGKTEIHYYYKSAKSRPIDVLNAAKNALSFYENSVGVYPWKQLNIVENDMYLNGMEYSTFLLLSSKAVEKGLQQTIFHEVGHQWFYNVIGSDQYQAPYLDEGLVEFLTCLALGKNEQQHQNITGLNRNLDSFNSWKSYREIHYRNGRLLFDSIYKMLGKTEFEKFIKEYYHRYEFSFVTPEEFHSFLAQKIGEENARKLLK